MTSLNLHGLHSASGTETVNKKALFITGSDRKAQQAQQALRRYGIEVETRECDVDEIQSTDAAKISTAKAKAAYAIVQKPLVVNDHFWSIPALGGFPGGYIKDINNWFEPEDYLALMKNKTDRSATLTEHVVYFDGQEIKQFSVSFKGKFVHEPKGESPINQEKVFSFDGSDKTIAEYVERGENALDVDKSAWHKFGEWFKNND